MTGAPPDAPEHLIRRGAATAAPAPAALLAIHRPESHPLARDADIAGATLKFWHQLRKQESCDMPHSNIFAAAAVLHKSGPSAHSGLADHDLPGIAKGDGDCAPRPWPFNPDDASPLGWWRTLPADQLLEAQQKMLRTAIEKICALKNRKWLVGVPDDAASSIALALGTLPLTAITLEVDLAMSALAVSALGGNAASALVLSHILRLAPLGHPFGSELSATWLRLTPQRALVSKACTARRATANRRLDDHQAACHAGDNA